MLGQVRQGMKVYSSDKYAIWHKVYIYNIWWIWSYNEPPPEMNTIGAPFLSKSLIGTDVDNWIYFENMKHD